MKTAYLSVEKKDESEIVARAWQENDYQLVASAGTARYLGEMGVSGVISPAAFLKVADQPWLQEMPEAERREAVGVLLAQSAARPKDEQQRLGKPVLDALYVNLKPRSVLLDPATGRRGMHTDRAGMNLIQAAMAGYRDLIVDPIQIEEYVTYLSVGEDLRAMAPQTSNAEHFERLRETVSLVADYWQQSEEVIFDTPLVPAEESDLA